MNSTPTSPAPEVDTAHGETSAEHHYASCFEADLELAACWKGTEPPDLDAHQEAVDIANHLVGSPDGSDPAITPAASATA